MKSSLSCGHFETSKNWRQPDFLVIWTRCLLDIPVSDKCRLKTPLKMWRGILVLSLTPAMSNSVPFFSVLLMHRVDFTIQDTTMKSKKRLLWLRKNDQDVQRYTAKYASLGPSQKPSSYLEYDLLTPFCIVLCIDRKIYINKYKGFCTFCTFFS